MNAGTAVGSAVANVERKQSQSAVASNAVAFEAAAACEMRRYARGEQHMGIPLMGRHPPNFGRGPTCGPDAITQNTNCTAGTVREV